MVLMKLLSSENGLIRYSYQPEKDGEPGILSYDKNNDKPKVELVAQNDLSSTFYRNPAFSMIRKTASDPPQERLLMWY